LRVPPRGALLAIGLLAVACTGGEPTTSTPDATAARALPATVQVGRTRFDVTCTPVAEALVDIELPHAGQPKIRAVTGLWDRQAVGVLANDPKGCGVWTLGLAQGLSQEAADQIRQEVADGINTFGVTASPVPREP
jgi:hypothetical protein